MSARGFSGAFSTKIRISVTANNTNQEYALPVKIRLARGGRKKVARYRIVAADGRAPRDGRFLETLGYYNPEAEPKDFEIKTDRMAYWLGQGAVPSLTVKNLLRQDRFEEKKEAIVKGLSVEEAKIERVAERKRKAKPKPQKAE
jgi:small subunit ribosomal protein S16